MLRRAAKDCAAATIVAKPYLSHARVLARSFREHHPQIPFFTLLADEVGGCFDPRAEPYELIELRKLDLGGAREQVAYRFRYEQQELSYALTPHLVEHLQQRGYRRVVFIKQESLVLGRLAPMFDALSTASVVLTPHLLAPSTAAQELMVLLAGAFNGGIVGVAEGADGRAFLRWWQDRVRLHCVRDVANGLHFEQRWLDLVPGQFEGVHPLRDPAVNVGHWNLAERAVRIRDGRVLVGDEPCLLFRFSGYSPQERGRVTAYVPQRTLADVGAAGAVFERFCAQLEAAGWAQSSAWPYAWATFSDGVAIPPIARELYRELGDGAARFGDPFRRDAPGGFAAWLGEPLDGGPVTRLWQAVLDRREDVRRAFPDPRGADSEPFAHWAGLHGAREYGVPAELLAGLAR
jgi:hypothetical protein